MTGPVVMLLVLVALALLAPFYGADTRDSRDWRPACGADCPNGGLCTYRS